MNSYLQKSWISMWQLKEKLRESSTAAQVKSNPRALRKLDRFTAVGDWSPNLSGTIVFPRLKKRAQREQNSLRSRGRGPSCICAPEKEERHAQTQGQHTHACTHLPLMFLYSSFEGPESLSHVLRSFFPFYWIESLQGLDTRKKEWKKKSIRSLLNLAFLTF